LLFYFFKPKPLSICCFHYRFIQLHAGADKSGKSAFVGKARFCLCQYVSVAAIVVLQAVGKLKSFAFCKKTSYFFSIASALSGCAPGVQRAPTALAGAMPRNSRNALFKNVHNPSSPVTQIITGALSAML
jgi:hypothetical protein